MKKTIKIINTRLLFNFILCIGLSINSFSQKKQIPLWNKIPNSKKNKTYKEEPRLDKRGKRTGIKKVTEPTITPFLVNNDYAKNTAVIICPGGGYSVLSFYKEGIEIAKYFNSIGISAFVLKYRLPTDIIMKDKTIGPLQDAQEAVRLVRRNAKLWNININKIGIIGFSAGGHLASTLSTHFNDKVYKSNKLSAKPDFSILIYPVISMEDGITHKGSKINLLGIKPSKKLIEKFSNEKKVTAETPPTFLVHSTNDKSVPVENSINYYLALKKEKVSAEMHLYKDGGHGFGLGKKGTSIDWSRSLKKWLEMNHLIPKKPVYMFSYFKGNGEDGLHFAYSNDGHTFKTLKNDTSFLTPDVGKDKLMRDPCIIKGEDGLYHMVWTVSWTDKGIGYANSKDLINWSKQQFIPVMQHEEATRNTWAPEITYDQDNKEFMIYWASTITGAFPETQITEDNGYNHRMYYTTTKDFKDFSDTKLLYDPGFNVIDATIQKNGDTFIMFLKDETKKPVQKNIKIAFSDNLRKGYTKASNPITGKYWAEGPTAIKINDEWIVYFDKYTNKKYGAISSKDLKNWKDISDKITFPKGARHGTIFTISQKEFEELKKNIE